MSQAIINFLRGQFKDAHGWIEGTIEGVDQKLAEENINPQALTIGGQYLHIITGVDILVLDRFGGQQMVMNTLSETDRGFSPLPPKDGGGDWEKTAKFDLEKLKKYCSLVFEAVDTYLAKVSDAQLEEKVNMGPMGNQPKSTYLNMALLNIVAHTGEIANMKGLKGLKGYPW